MRPIPLPANTVRQPYRGGERIADLRRISHDAVIGPEDWVGSVTARFGAAPVGLTRLETGELLADVVSRDPEAFLGPELAAATGGTTTGVLVKLLDAGERLVVHYHPSRSFAGAHLASPYGKTESWIVLSARPGAEVWFGFNRDITATELTGLVQARDPQRFASTMNRLPVEAGDVVLVPGGVPHSIGEGVLVVELQEPTDFSLMLESWDPTDDIEAGFCGLPMDLALECVDRSAWPVERLAEHRRSVATGRTIAPGISDLMPSLADPFFRAQQITTPAVLAPQFSILIAVTGRGTLTAGDNAPLPVSAGQTILVPYAAGPVTVDGSVTFVRALPPEPRHLAALEGLRS